jgi:hypothetical protein
MRTPRTPADLGFDRHDQHRLARAVESCSDARTFRRLQAVLLVARGRTVSEVARFTDLKPWAIYAWVRRYLADHCPDSRARGAALLFVLSSTRAVQLIPFGK